ARKRAPRAQFRNESFLATKLPPCVVVTSLGECFSYLFDRRNTALGLRGLLRRIYRALRPGGLLVFDVVAPGRIAGRGPQRNTPKARTGPCSSRPRRIAGGCSWTGGSSVFERPAGSTGVIGKCTARA